MKHKVVDYFNSLKSGQKRVFVALGIGTVLCVIGVFGYISSSKKIAPAAAAAKAKTPATVVNMDNKMLETNQLLDAKKEAQVAKEQLEEEKKKNEEAEKAVKAGLTAPLGGASGKNTVPNNISEKIAVKAFPSSKTNSKTLPPLPPLPSQGQNLGAYPLPPGVQNTQNSGMPAPVTESEIGGIMRVTNANAGKEEKEAKKKDTRKSVYLPISYMEATMLSGLYAPIGSAGKSHPVPALIRVKTPAVLPNEVKANLKGCFVIADGKGNLGTERADMVLVSLSCIDRKGQSVIDERITGYIVDSDGKAGLKGNVVTKMGAMIARSMLAGMFGGFGEALKSANTTSSLSALGNVQTIEPEKIGMAGLGSGLAGGFKEVQKFYTELAKETMPVIEIGAARRVTLVLTKGANLEIKKIFKGEN